MAGDPLDVISSKTVHARDPRLWCEPVRFGPHTTQSWSYRWRIGTVSDSARRLRMIKYDLTKQQYRREASPGAATGFASHHGM